MISEEKLLKTIEDDDLKIKLNQYKKNNNYEDDDST